MEWHVLICLAQPKPSLVLHTNRSHCPKEHVQKDNRRHSVGDSVSSALTCGKAKKVFLVINPGEIAKREGILWELLRGHQNLNAFGKQHVKRSVQR